VLFNCIRGDDRSKSMCYHPSLQSILGEQISAQPVPEKAARQKLEANPWQAEPSCREVLLLTTFTYLMFAAVILTSTSFTDLVDKFGDSSAYMSVASALRRWSFDGIVVKQFWGLPYLMAAVSFLTGISDRTSLLLVSLLSSLLSVVLAYRLWGGWVAGFFVVLNFDWMQRSLLGGSEPLFMALLLGAFLSIRREQWLIAALLASLATVVRPLGLFALIGVGLTLLRKQDFRKLTYAVLIGLVIGALYVLPLAQHFGDPLANVSRYQITDWDGSFPFTWPFLAFVYQGGLQPAPWTNLALTFGWIFFAVLGSVAMIGTERFRNYGRTHLAEILFAAPYLAFLFMYNSSFWARSNFPRFVIPVIPFVLFALDKWIPKDRRLMWSLGLGVSVLAASSALGIRNIMSLLHKTVG